MERKNDFLGCSCQLMERLLWEKAIDWLGYFEKYNNSSAFKLQQALWAME